MFRKFIIYHIFQFLLEILMITLNRSSNFHGILKTNQFSKTSVESTSSIFYIQNDTKRNSHNTWLKNLLSHTRVENFCIKTLMGMSFLSHFTHFWVNKNSVVKNDSHPQILLIDDKLKLCRTWNLTVELQWS